MDLLSALARRHTVKAYDPARTLPPEPVAQLLAALRWSPSSVNSQPWHFILAGDAAGKARIARSTTGEFAYNAPKVANASHVLVLCARDDLPAAHLQALLEQEQADGRFAGEQARENQRRTRAGYLALHAQAGDTAQWAQKQTYLALGFLLLSAALLEVDATPMEGFDAQALAAEFGLQAQGLTPLVLVALGCRSEADFNAGLPKSRLPDEALFTRA
ncbi:MAG: oxygen-insensitive NAD(P)H nitroreductase [Pseudoxanthomonas sp.]